MAKGKKKTIKPNRAVMPGTEANVFDNPEGALVAGSAEHMAVMEGNAVQGPDELEVNDSPEARAILVRAIELVKFVDTAYWELSAVLAEISNKKLYKLDNYTTFESYLQDSCHMERRKGYYFVQIHNYFNAELRTLLSDKQEDYDHVIGAAKTIGWSKAAKLASEHVITKDNVREVVDKAKTCTLRDLDLICKSYFSAMHADDKQAAKDNNDVKTVKMSFQCTLPQKQDVEEAIELAVKLMDKEGVSKSSALAWVCRDFAATNIAARGKDVGLAETMSKFERLLGVTLIAVDESVGRIVYGVDSVNKLAGRVDDMVPLPPVVGVETTVSQ